jgi:N6-adenosine-specific RNA methylase IME4
MADLNLTERERAILTAALGCIKEGANNVIVQLVVSALREPDADAVTIDEIRELAEKITPFEPLKPLEIHCKE